VEWHGCSLFFAAVSPQVAQFTIKTNLKQSEEFEDNHDNDNYSYYVEDVSAHAGD
jgi:anti-anti-sigma regulatory factor